MSLNGGKQKSESSSMSRPTTPQELEAYFQSLGNLSGGKLGNWAQYGTQQTDYNPISQQQLQAIGGAGATRQLGIDQALKNQHEQIQRDSGLTYAQIQQARQQASESAMSQKDAINKEVEAALTGLASQEAMRQYQAAFANAGLTAQDLALLSQIYFGGKGQYSTSKSKSSGWRAGMSLTGLTPSPSPSPSPIPVE